MIPFASLAAILIYTGYKLTKLAIFKEFYRKGWEQFLPFVITIVAIILTDLLIGILIGCCVGLFFLLRSNFKSAILVVSDDNKYLFRLRKDVSFLNKPIIKRKLEEVPQDSFVLIDAGRADFIDRDVVDVIEDFMKHAHLKDIQVELKKNIYKEHGFSEFIPVTVLPKKINCMQSFERLLLENKAWAQEALMEDPEFFNRLAKTQTPEFLWIGCSDSRVPANKITGTNPGELFVHRNIANLVVDNDINLLSVLEYAVTHLKVKHVIVCGHHGCGGIRAAMGDESYGILDGWLSNIKQTYAAHRAEIDAVPDIDDRVNMLSEFSVKQQAINISKTETIQKAWAKGNLPQIHGWAYSLKDGILKKSIPGNKTSARKGTAGDVVYLVSDW